MAQDYAQALVWYRKAADQGFATAQGGLGFMYENGQGVPQDYAQAAMWYRRAADQGFAPAQNNLGNHLRQRQWRAAYLRAGPHVVSARLPTRARLRLRAT